MNCPVKIQKQPYVILNIKIIHILDTLQIDGIVLKRKQIHTRCPVNDCLVLNVYNKKMYDIKMCGLLH